MALQQLTEISTGSVVQEADDATPLPVFGGPWGDLTQFEWRPAPAARKLELAKSAKLAEITSAYQTLLDAGVTYTGTLFQSDAQSINNMAEVLTAVANGWPLPAGFAWIDAANNAVPADAAFLKGLSSAFADHKSALFSRLQVAKAKLAAATTITAVSKVTL